ncbi:MAG: PDZ domain-containing protein [Planctomycetes bacterium]|nr:PDZ domain-containing protein [Planctomycetota bacterium]
MIATCIVRPAILFRPLLLATAIGLVDARAAEPSPVRSHLQPVSEIARSPVTGEGLGIRVSRASAVLRQQLALERGAGLVVEDVAGGSRAAAAGLVQHDVLVRLDDQLLVLPEQFDALLEAAAPSDQLTCTVLRGGRTLAIPLVAGHAASRPATAAVKSPARRPLRPTASALAITRPAAPEDEAAGRLRQLADETLLRQDTDFEIRLSRGDATRLLVREPGGRIVFEGPIDAAADRAHMPAAVRSRVAEMERLLEPRSAVPRDATGTRPVAEIGRLDIKPVELR